MIEEKNISEEKRFKIQKIEKYNEKISKERKYAIYYVMVAAFSAGAFLGTVNNILNGSFDMPEFCTILAGIDFIAFGVSLNNIIKSICRKTIYETKVEEIQEQLELMKAEMQSDRPRSNRRRS